jgi:predicted AlkP superfamily phosphohydrolase/phosphomutase
MNRECDYMGVSRNVKEFDDGRMSGKEKNPKQVLIDWVKNVDYAATCGKSAIHGNNGLSKEKKLEVASGQFERILGQCEAMMTVLNNSD